MGSVVTLDLPFRQTTRDARQTALLQRFACERRPDTDVFWLKENAELLNILECTGTRPDGSPVNTEGQGIEVVRRQPGGNWLFIIDIPRGLP